MKLRHKIFDVFIQNESVLEDMHDEHDELEENNKELDPDIIFLYKNPFDFYRSVEKSKKYIPVTQRGLRKAYTEGIIGIESFIEMATSLRPLADEAQDIDEIARLLSQQKLTANPNLHSVMILRNLIKDPNPEIALYAAEGLNTIENTFIEKIQRVKQKITDKKEKDYILYFILGLLFIEFAKLLHGQKLIQLFYLKEALSALKTADNLKQNNKRILRLIGDVYILLGENDKAIKVFTYLFSENSNDRNVLMKLAECYYKNRDYQNVITLANLAAKRSMQLDEISNLIIYQWTLNI